MRCKHCGKELKYDINNDTYAIYNGNIYCNTDCILYDIDYSSVDVSSFNKEDWDSSINWDDKNENRYYILHLNTGYYIITNTTRISMFLTFQSKVIAQEFLNNFRDLIKQAGDLI